MGFHISLEEGRYRGGTRDVCEIIRGGLLWQLHLEFKLPEYGRMLNNTDY